MEAVGFTVGAVGLVGTFTACVDCFDYIRIGRRLGRDYETSVIKLDLIRLRFTRWGEAAGLSQVDEAVAYSEIKQQRLAVRDEDIETIRRTLGKILNLFETSAKESKRFALKNLNDKDALAHTASLKDVKIRDLHDRMRDIAITRQKRSTLSQKISWALYRKRDIEGLIEDLTDLVSALVDLVPAERQLELCSSELTTMSTDQELITLDDILSEPVGGENVEIDSALHQCVTDKMEQRRGAMTTAVWKKSKAGDGSTIRQGDNIADGFRCEIINRDGNYVVVDSELGKNVVFHQGNNYGITR